MRDVLVTGIGIISCIGNDKAAVKDSLVRLKHGFERHVFTNAPRPPISVLGTVKGFKTDTLDTEDWEFPPEYKVSRALLRGFSPHGLFAHCAVIQALRDAGLPEEGAFDERTGLFTASGGSVWMMSEYMNIMRRHGVDRVNPKAIVASVAGTLNFNLVSCFKIRGATCGFVSACASSAHALGYAMDEIRMGRQDRMIVVGAEDGNDDCVLPFAGMRTLSTDSDPDRASRPFDKTRNGFVGTGGGVVLVLESRELAEERGANVYARLRGWAQTSDGFNAVLPHPEGEGLQRAMRAAMADAGVSVEEVDYVNAHAPSTVFGDAAEAIALRNLFGEGGNPSISSTKALHGHGITLSGILEAAISVLSLSEGFCPGSAHIEELGEEMKGLNIIRETVHNRPRIAISNSSGFGGANVCLVFDQPQ